MAEDSGSNAILGVLVGIVLVAAFIFFFAPSWFGWGDRDVNIKIEVPEAPKAPAAPKG